MDKAFLAHIGQVLTSAGSPSNDVQKEVMNEIERCSLRSDFGATLGYLLSSSGEWPIDVRQRAGLLLKTLLTRGTVHPTCPGVSENALKAITDSEVAIRRAGSSVITTIVTISPELPCRDILAGLTRVMSDTGSPVLADGAFDAIYKISEDLIDLWRNSMTAVEGNRESPRVVEDFLQFADQALVPVVLSLKVAKYQAKLLNLYASNFLFFPNHPLAAHLRRFFECIGLLAASQTDSDTLSEVIKALIYIARHHADMCSDSFPAITRLMLDSSRRPEYNVRLESLQFWQVAATNVDWLSSLQSFLPELLPVILFNMIYSQEDYLNLDEAVLVEDNATVPDRPEELAPRFHKEKEEEADDLDDSDHDEKEANSTWGTEWTVRKAAASALDHLATAYGDTILPNLIPLIEERLKSNEWEVQESAVLALGAIGQGCIQGLSPHLPSILELLVSISKSKKPLLRSISCWTISRFAAWIAFDTHRHAALPLALSVILSRMMDQNKRVQEAAVSAFVSLEEELGSYLDEHLPDILRAISASLNYYQSKNLLILLDSVACLFESLGSETMSKPEVTNTLVPPIVAAFSRVDPKAEKQLSVSLFECLTSITTTCGPAIGDDVLCGIVSRCGSIIEMNLSVYRRITQGMENCEKPDPDLLACSLDLLCGVVDGLGNASGNLVMKLNFIPLLQQLIMQFEFQSNLPLVRNYYTNTVRQCAFALLGDTVRTCTTLVSDDILQPVIPTVIAYVTIGPVLVSNNSSWALGEICMRRSLQFIDPFVDTICKALLFNLKRFEPGTRPIVRQNAAIALGRLALVAPRRLVESGCFLEMFSPFCELMKKLRTDGEKITAIKGFTLCIEASPQTGMTPDNLALLFELIASLFPPPSTLAASLRGILVAYRELLGESSWKSLWSRFPLEVQYRLNHSYSLGMDISQAT